MAVNENATVNVIGGFYKGRSGKVISTFPYMSLAIVSFDENGDVGKVSFSDLVEVKSPIEEKAPEIPEGAIQISRDDFREAVKNVTHPDNIFTEKVNNPMSNFLRGVATMLVYEKVGDKMFQDKNVVTMTRDEFIAAFWSICNPVFAAETVDNKLSVTKSVSIATTALVGLTDFVDILFGPEND